MELININLTLDSKFKGCEKLVNVVQGESAARQLIITITDGSTVVHLDPETDIAIIRGLKPDKTLAYNMAEIRNDKVYYTLSTADTATAGTGLYQLQIFRNEEERAIIYQSVQFNTYVNENVTTDGEVESTDEFTALQGLIATVGSYGNINNRLKKIEHEIINSSTGRIIYNGQQEESSDVISVTDYDRLYFTGCVYGADVPVALLRYMRIYVDRFHIDAPGSPETVEVTDEKQIIDVMDYDSVVIRMEQEGSAFFKVDYCLVASTFFTKEVTLEMLDYLDNSLKTYMQQNYVPLTRTIAGLNLSENISSFSLAMKLLEESLMVSGIKSNANTEIRRDIVDIISDNISYILRNNDTENALKNFLTDNVLRAIYMNGAEAVANNIFIYGIENYSAYQMVLYNALQKTTILNLINTLINDTHYTKTQVDNIIGALNTGGFRKVEELPVTGEEKYIYLVLKEDEEEHNIYEEYIWIDEDWEKIGDTKIDLSNYIQTEDLAAAVTTLEGLISAAEASAKNASVPTSRTVAGLALSSDITKSAITQEVLRQIPNEGVTWGQYMMPLLTRYFYTETEIENKLGNYTKIYTASSMPADVLTEWPDIIAGNLINITGTGTLYLVKAVTTTTVILEEVIKKEDVILKNKGIKVYVGISTPTSNLQDYPGITGGDIYFQGAGGADRDSSPLVYMYYAYIVSGTLYWNEIALMNNVYKKSEVNTLLDAKQPVLTAGNNLNINSENTISYKESEWELLKTVEATEDHPLSEIVWETNDLVNGTYDDIMVKATNVLGNGTTGNYAFQCKTTANQYNAGVFGILLASGVSSTTARNFFTKIERLNNTTEFELTSWYVDNYLNKECSVIHTAPGLVANDPSHKLYYLRFYFSSTNSIKSGTFKIYGRKRIY